MLALERFAQCTNLGKGLRRPVILRVLPILTASVQRLLRIAQVAAELFDARRDTILHIEVAVAVTLPNPFSILLHAQRQFLLFGCGKRLAQFGRGSGLAASQALFLLLHLVLELIELLREPLLFRCQSSFLLGCETGRRQRLP